VESAETTGRDLLPSLRALLFCRKKAQKEAAPLLYLQNFDVAMKKRHPPTPAVEDKFENEGQAGSRLLT
jgi:hypothetical protein